MNELPRVAVLAAVVLVAAGCSQSHRRDLCEGGALACADEGAARCSDDGGAVEVCEPDGEGCLVWTVDQRCAETDACEDDGGEPTCVCRSDCEREGATRCAGDRLEVCEGDGDGCLAWVLEEDCGAASESCVEVGDGASCEGECPPPCDPGASRCEGSVLVSCVEDRAGCWTWVDEEDCAESGRFCSDAGGRATCEESCSNECADEGASRCAGAVVQLCAEVGPSCLSWTDGDDCSEAGLVCVDYLLEATCGCGDPCPVGETRCAGDVVQACEWDEVGCASWVDQVDCAAFGLPCSDAGEPAECLNGSGDDCADPIVVLSSHEVYAGSSFSTDFGDDATFSDPTCLARDGQPEAVFAVDVEEGGTIVSTELGPIDVTVSVQSVCDPAGPCELSVDDLPDSGLAYDVPSAGRYYVIVERSLRGGETYEVDISVRYPEDCGDGLDNDLDDLVDCDDPDCFGAAPGCTVERRCDDGEDNDLDDLVDCDDPDCGVEPACRPVQGYWELFEAGDLPDVAGHAVTFTPDPASAEGYGWTERGGVTALPVAPGSGAPSAVLSLTDDSFVEVDLTAMPGFTFYGTRYASIFVGSNGYVTFGEGSRSWSGYLDDHFARPSVSGLRTDLNPAAGGRVVVDQLADRVAVTYEDVPRYGRAEPNTFQVLLHSDGSIELAFLTTPVEDALVGISSGVGLPEYPAETDFVGPAAEDCGDGIDDDFDGAIDCADRDCFGDPVDCGAEALCDDGLDNDGDGDVDCDDPDCAGPSCSPYRGYWERFETGDPPDLEGRSIAFSPSAASPEGYTWTLAPMSSTTFPVPPGTGLTSTELTLGDDDFDEVALVHMAGFPFYDLTWTSLFVSSNGYVTFGSGSGSPANDPADHFALPGVSAFRRDMMPSPGTRVVVDEFADRAVVTWEGAMGYAGPNDMQVVLGATGLVTIHYVHVPVRDRVTGLAGISNGLGDGTWPAETSFVP